MRAGCGSWTAVLRWVGGGGRGQFCLVKGNHNPRRLGFGILLCYDPFSNKIF